MKTSGISSESGERNKITEVLLRWAGKTELFPGGFGSAAGVPGRGGEFPGECAPRGCARFQYQVIGKRVDIFRIVNSLEKCAENAGKWRCLPGM